MDWDSVPSGRVDVTQAGEGPSLTASGGANRIGTGQVPNELVNVPPSQQGVLAGQRPC